MKVNEFLAEVYEWLCRPNNRCVEDWHYSCADVEDEKSFRGTIRQFLTQRWWQMFGCKPDSKFMYRATTKYIYNMYH